MRRWCYTSTFMGRMRSQTYSAIPNSLQDWAIKMFGSKYAGMLTRENELATPTSITSIKSGHFVVSEAVRTRWHGPPSELESIESFALGPAVFVAKQEARSNGAVGNSIVFIHAARLGVGLETLYHPAILDEIVQVRAPPNESNPQLYALVRPYKELSQADAGRDLFRHPLWQQLGCKMTYRSTHLQVLLPVTEIVCHAARCQYRPYKENHRLSKDAYIFICLDRVRFLSRSSGSRI